MCLPHLHRPWTLARSSLFALSVLRSSSLLWCHLALPCPLLRLDHVGRYALSCRVFSLSCSFVARSVASSWNSIVLYCTIYLYLSPFHRVRLCVARVAPVASNTLANTGCVVVGDGTNPEASPHGHSTSTTVSGWDVDAVHIVWLALDIPSIEQCLCRRSAPRSSLAETLRSTRELCSTSAGQILD